MRQLLFALIIGVLGLSSCAQSRPEKQTSAKNQVSSKKSDVSLDSLQVATFAGGCFWCTEQAAEKLKGVHEAISGYTGGHTVNPTYEETNTGTTGHAEAIQIYYDSTVVSYQTLLEGFFAIHDPTTLNRQGPDVGPQYRSAIFYGNPREKAQAEAYIQKLNSTGVFQNPIVTEVAALKEFYPAEDYHQDFYIHNPNNPYMRSVSAPKLQKFEMKMAGKLKEMQ